MYIKLKKLWAKNLKKIYDWFFPYQIYYKLRDINFHFQKSADVIAKIPTILLSISYKGVKFIDAKTKKVICDHEIGNIFCACQDAQSMNFFAYITRDNQTAKHYCHVFNCRTAVSG